MLRKVTVSSFFNFLLASTPLLIGIIFVFGFIVLQKPTFKYFGLMSYDTTLYLLNGFLALSEVLVILLVVSILFLFLSYIWLRFSLPKFKYNSMLLLSILGIILSIGIFLFDGWVRYYLLFLILVLFYYTFWNNFVAINQIEEKDFYGESIANDDLIRTFYSFDFERLSNKDLKHDLVRSFSRFFEVYENPNTFKDFSIKIDLWLKGVYSAYRYKPQLKMIVPQKDEEIINYLIKLRQDFRKFYKTHIDLHERKKVFSYNEHARYFLLILLVVLMVLTSSLTFYYKPTENFITNLPMYTLSIKNEGAKRINTDVYFVKFIDGVLYGFDAKTKKALILEKEKVSVLTLVYRGSNQLFDFNLEKSKGRKVLYYGITSKTK